jgi:hypothetical protein
MNAALAALSLVRLLSVPSALVAEALPDHDTHGWTVRMDVYTETYDNGARADLVDVYATPAVGGEEYLLSVSPTKAGGLVVCAVYARAQGAKRWAPMTVNSVCE